MLIKIIKWAVIGILCIVFWPIAIIVIPLVLAWRVYRKKKSSRITTNEDLRSYVDNDEYRQFQLNVAGITHKNEDGSKRADVAFSCHYGQKLLLVRDPENPYDSNAVQVLTEYGQQLGFIDSWNAKEMQASLKGTSRVYERIEAIFIEAGMFRPEGEKRDVPFCSIAIRRYYKKAETQIAE
ncbi:HIRAN domain-containing protein [Paenibacillus thermotolerans]|uniref:HIRAN domain-containing protein n=1 Tax=Paenibacillus thermotolerans TaxID=3027807 RepID=UPI00236892C0|nr:MULTISPECIES: HIRAN domain-containing protein [unclassified Paenibacillus]